MEPGGSIPHSQGLFNNPYSEPNHYKMTSAEVFSKALLNFGNGKIPVGPSTALFRLNQIFVNSRRQKKN
jgi:hypothetical protein